MNENATLLATEVLDILKISMSHLHALIENGALSPVYIGTSPFNINAARFSRVQVETVGKRIIFSRLPVAVMAEARRWREELITFIEGDTTIEAISHRLKVSRRTIRRKLRRYLASKGDINSLIDHRRTQ